MRGSPLLITEPRSVEARLSEIGGLTPEILHEVALQGEQARSIATENHPVTAGGLMAYFARVCALRDQMLPRQWTKRCDSGSELTISPDGRHVLVVASGDENTGSFTQLPKTKCPKGIKLEEAATLNELQYDFFIEPTPPRPRPDVSGVFTWVLLIGRTEERLSVELALPVALGEDGRASEWVERIILPSIPLTDDGASLRPEPGPDFDVGVSRRVA